MADKIIPLLIKSLQTKFKKLLWARSNPTPIGLKHDESWKRITIAYPDFVRLSKTYGDVFLDDRWSTQGIIVIAPPAIVDSDEDIDRWLMARLGSDNNISCVIGITGPGTASKKFEVDAFLLRAKDEGWNVLQKRRGIGPTGNKHWYGHYFVSLAGNGTSSFKTGCVPLGNDAIEFCSKEDTEFIKAQVLYMMLCARGSERFFKDSSKFLSAKDELRVYCETNRLLEWSRFPVSPLSVDGSLRCWSENEITADNFLCVQYDNMYAEKCHVDSVATACLDFDPIAKKLKTCCRMYGFVWGIKRFNMLQSSRNIEDARRDLNLDAVAEVAQLRRRLAKYETV